jgi:hypothetical protein
MQLSQTGTDKNPLQNRIPGITHILQLVITIPSLISYYAVKVYTRVSNERRAISPTKKE